MNIGGLKKRITLQSPIKTIDVMGGSTVTWKNEMTVWAAIWSTLSSEAVRSGQLTLEITHRIRIRYRADVKGSWRASYAGRYFSIVSIINPDMANRSIDLLCKETET